MVEEAEKGWRVSGCTLAAAGRRMRRRQTDAGDEK